MHSYDPSRQPYQSQIPSMRPASDGPAGHSPTPIYDALYSEYRRAFRAFPGDRSGEEDLDFRAFGTGPHSSHGGPSGHPGHTVHPGTWQSYPGVRPHSGMHKPAALPPAPRRGL
ncbi:hypothetical protein OG735_09475 [Streptomyces sp. NBC_01210]|uniref:hypothetical protein n=2 Tax=unclassified Streptomyces TaxID=2593676 RepID=UPI002E104F13|nr:hypothetical protein OG735_09475 [Streptomyces sp. NBC_01210]